MTRKASRPSTARSKRGFTLLEVLVSSAILLALLVLLLGACEGGTRFWNQAERRRAPLREAGASLRFIGRDLRSAVITDDPSSLLIRKETNGGASLFFLVSHSPDHRPEATPGDLCATGYFLAPSLEGQKERDLYRFHASGRGVLEALRSGKLPELYASALPGTTNTELLARHVASFEVRPLASGTAPDHPPALVLDITTVDAFTDALLASAGTDRAKREKLLADRGARLGGVVRLPPARHSPSHL